MQPITQRRWRLKEPDPAVVRHLATACNLPSLLARLLANRAVTEPEAARRFLAPNLAEIPDPFLLFGMEEAVARLTAARRNGERVCIHGDYDVDGITATALLVSFFRAVGIAVDYHLPLRLEEGYGLSAAGIRAAAAQGARVIVSVDCGITAHAEARLCRELGLDLIVTDHHLPENELPPARAVINPHQPGCPYPFKGLAGVGIAFQLALALRRRLRDEGAFTAATEPNLREYLDLVALGTVADVAPLVAENRVFVSFGLRELSTGARPGVRALKEVAGVSEPVSCGAVGFRLAPRLNAAGRLDDAATGVELLLCTDPVRARELAAQLDAENAARQALEQEILRDALEQLRSTAGLRGRKSIVLASEQWHPGVIGIVASRLVDLYHRPTILISLREGEGKGSGRSIPGLHLRDALAACAGHLAQFGGHRQAAGLTIDEATLAAFVDHFDQVVNGTLSEEDLTPELALDGELTVADLTLAGVEQLAVFAPFGIGNPEPLFLLRDVRVRERRLLNDVHVKLKVEVGGRHFDAIGFHLLKPEPGAERVDLACTPQINEWQGRRSVQLRLKDVRNAV